MRPERLYLSDIVEAAGAIRGFIDGVQETEFLNNDMIQSAVLQKLMIIGEAAAHLSKEFCENNPEIPWSDIVGFRNIAVHAYFAVEWPIVWFTATQDVPDLRAQVVQILAREFPEERTGS